MKQFYIFIFMSFFPKIYSSITYDFEQYSRIGLIKKFNKNFDMSIDSEYRCLNKTNANYLHIQLGGSYKNILKHVDLSSFYRFIKYKQKNCRTKRQRFFLNLIFKGKSNNFKFSDRIGWEYRDRRETHNIFFIKNMIKIGYELRTKDSSVQPYIADDIMIDVNENDAHRNRLYFGLFSKQSDFLILDFYYYWERFWECFNQSKKNSNIFGIKIIFFIPEKKKKQVFNRERIL